MGGENKVTNTGKQATTTAPFEPVQPMLETGFGDAFQNYANRRGMTPGYEQTRNLGEARFGDTATRFANNNPLGGALDSFRGSFGSGGFNDPMRQAMSGTGSLTGPQTSLSEENLMGVARGDMLNLDNPDFERILNSASDRAATEASMAASGMGRTGSDYHQGVVADRVGDLIANARLGQYNTERDRQVQANQLIDSARDSDQAFRLGALGQQFGMGQQGMTNTANAGNVFNSLYDGLQQPSQDLISLGQTPQRDIGGLLGLAGYGAPYGTTLAEGTDTTSKPSNWFGKLAGGLLGGSSLLFG